MDTPRMEAGRTYRVVVEDLAEFVGVYLGPNEVGRLAFKYRLDADAKGRNTVASMFAHEITSAEETTGPLRPPGVRHRSGVGGS